MDKETADKLVSWAETYNDRRYFEEDPIIFPRYFRNEHYRTYTMDNTLSMLLEDVLYNLTKQISLVWKHLEGKAELTQKQTLEEAQEIAVKFFE